MNRQLAGRRAAECVFSGLLLAVLLSSGLGQAPDLPKPAATPGPRWAPVTPDLSTAHDADLSGYDASCIARLEPVDGREVVTMVACPDGRVGWFD